MPNKPNANVWNLSFALAEYTPAEAEAMTGVPRDSQRDWRRRGYLPRYAKHARFSFVDAAQLYIMKMLADAGKGPALSHAHAARLALALAKTGLTWRPQVWGGEQPEAAFDRIPPEARQKTAEEALDNERFGRVRLDNFEKRRWLADRLLWQLGVRDGVKSDGQIIWWPTGEVEIGDYNPERFIVRDEGFLDQIDAKFDGPAMVLDLEAVAANLARRSPRPWVSVKVTLNEAESINRPGEGYDHGTVTVETAKKAA